MSPDTRTEELQSVTLTSDAGFAVTVIDLGATLHSIRVPTADGCIETTLGYERPAEYLNDPYYLGTTVGRYANRIRGARFRLDGTEYELDANDQGHCLHGGRDGLHRQIWSLEHTPPNRAVECRYVSPDGQGGFPGTVEFVIEYQIVDELSLSIDYRATSDRKTVLSLANHAYFNLDAGAGTIDGHTLAVHADHYTPIDETMIPTGEIRPVDGSAFDLRSPIALGEETSAGHEPRRYDHNFVLAGPAGMLRPVAELYSPESDLKLRVHTTQPGLQCYTGEHLRAPFRARQGLCLEAQHFPDSPNQPDFPSAVLAPGERYQQRTIYEFLVGTR